jgi:hypothetical protein
MRRWAWLAIGAASTLAACAGAGQTSAGAPEEPDAGTPPAHDAAVPDGGVAPTPDASTDDAAGDAGAPRAVVPAIPCADGLDDVYVAPASLPPMAMDLRGAIVRCAKDTAFTAAEVTSKLAAKSVTGVTVASGTTFYRLAYRTYREDGVEGLSSARVYIPDAPRAFPMPVVAVAHPTEGLAAGCTPSKNATDLDDLALPWAAQGYAVIATDYAGLGTGGVQGYVANHDQAHSLLDSARALRALLDPRVFDDRVLLVGYSQGGGAVLASQGLASSYGAGGNVVAAVVFSAEYFARMDSFRFVTLMREPTELTIQTGVSKPVVSVMRSYAFASNLLGTANGTVPFPSAQRSNVEGALQTLCQTPLGGYLQATAPHIGDLYDPSFVTAFLACVDGQSGCAGPASQMVDWLKKDLVTPDPNGPPVLYVTALSDIIMPPNEEAACNVDLLDGAGVKVQVCTDGPAQHTNVVPRNVGFALQWSEAILSGTAAPSCSSQGMPACAP